MFKITMLIIENLQHSSKESLNFLNKRVAEWLMRRPWITARRFSKSLNLLRCLPHFAKMLILKKKGKERITILCISRSTGFPLWMRLSPDFHWYAKRPKIFQLQSMRLWPLGNTKRTKWLKSNNVKGINTIDWAVVKMIHTSKNS